MPDKVTAMDGLNWSLLIFLSVLWGGAFFFAGVAVRELPPLTVVLARVSLAALILLPLFWHRGFNLPRSLREWKPFIGMGLLNNVIPFGLLFAGQTYVGAGLASIINAMTPLFAVLVMAAFREEALTGLRVAGVTLGLVGVAVLQGYDGFSDASQTIGVGLCAGGALSYGVSALWARRHLSGVAPIRSATLQLISSSFVMVVVVSLIDQPWTLDMPSPATLWAVVGLAFLGTAVAYIVFFEIVVRAGASNVMLVTLLIPVSALMLGNLFLDEPIRGQELIGAAIIGIGLLFIDGRVPIWVRQRFQTKA